MHRLSATAAISLILIAAVPPPPSLAADLTYSVNPTGQLQIAITSPSSAPARWLLTSAGQAQATATALVLDRGKITGWQVTISARSLDDPSPIPPGPTPPPVPPPPPPDDALIPDGRLWLFGVVPDYLRQDPKAAAIQDSWSLRKRVEDHKGQFRWLDPANATNEQKPYTDRAQKDGLPRLIIVDARPDGAIVRLSAPMPATPADAAHILNRFCPEKPAKPTPNAPIIPCPNCPRIPAP